MRHNISSSRLRDYVEFFTKQDSPDDVDGYGQVKEDDVLVFDARANVEVKSGGKLQSYGTELTSSVVTSLMYFDSRITSAQTMHWEGGVYRVDHIQPDDVKHGMIVTATRIGEQVFQG